jgi:microcystin-dependent protein
VPIETFNYLDSLNSAFPVSSEGLVGGDDHIRGIKATLKAAFPNLNGAMTATPGQLNGLAGWYQNGINTSLPISAPSVELGPSGSFIDFHSGVIATDFDVRVSSSGGNGTAGHGVMTVEASLINTPAINASGNINSAGTMGSGGVLTGPVNCSSLSSSGAISGSSVSTAGAVSGASVSATGTVSGASVSASGAVSGASVAATGNVSGASVSATGSVSGSSVSASGTVQGNTVVGNTVVGAVPAGAIMDFAGPTAPSGWMACDGGSLSTTTFAQLFARIGYTWGGSGGSFNVPNLLSRYRRHRDNSTLAGSVGNTQGPVNLSHAHSIVGDTGGQSTGHIHHVDIQSGAMSTNANHSHTLSEFLVSVQNGTATNQGNLVNTLGGAAVNMTTSSTNIDHSHRVTGDTADVSADHHHAINFTSQASGDANEARPYSATVLTCIKLFD